MIRRIDQNGIISTLLGFNDLTSARPLSCDSVMDISQVYSSASRIFLLQRGPVTGQNKHVAWLLSEYSWHIYQHEHPADCHPTQMLTVTPGKVTALSRGIVASIRDMIGYRIWHQREKNESWKICLTLWGCSYYGYKRCKQNVNNSHLKYILLSRNIR